MKVGSTVELEFNDASGIEWKTSGDDVIKVGDTHRAYFILPVYNNYSVNQYGAFVFPKGVEPKFKVTSVSAKKITLEMISGDVPKELGVFFGVGQNRVNIIDKSKIDTEKMQYDVSTVATATIDGYEFVKTEKDREGNRIHWYKKVEQTSTTTTSTTTTTTTTTTEEPKTTSTTTTTTTEEPKTTSTTTTEEPKTTSTTTTTTTEEPKTTSTTTTTTTEEPKTTSTTTTTTEESTTTTTTDETTPGKSSEETPSGKTTEETRPETTSTTSEPKKELPNTGSKESLFATGVALLVAGLGVLGLKKQDN